MHLNCHSWFSLRYGIMSPEDLLQEAVRKGVNALALTDINNTSGVMDFVRLSKRYNIRPVAGIDFRNGAQQQFIGIARNNEGFLELNDFLSKHLHTGEPIPSSAPEFKNAYIIYPFSNELRSLRENEYIGLQPHELTRLNFSHWARQPHKLAALAPVTFRHDQPPPADPRTPQVTARRDFNAHRLLRAISNNIILSRLSADEQAQPNELLRSEKELKEVYNDHLRLVRTSRELLENCTIYFDFGTSKNKRYFFGNAQTDSEKLKKLCEDGLPYRYEKVTPAIRERLEKELDMIEEKGFASYFLINWDIVEFARKRGFFYVGRGSGANSMVAYLLRITDVDPIDLDLYFERFINPSRINPPDFDIDFSWKDRDEVIQYIFDTHGEQHTALLATYSTFQSNAVVRELGKVFGLPPAEIDQVQAEGLYAPSADNIARLVRLYSLYLHDVPNHLGIHAGGILISERPIHYYTATTRPPKDFPLVQFSMLEAEDVGLYKFDILSQRGLGHIKDAVEMVKKNKGEEIDIHDIRRFKEDKKIRHHLMTARAIGCFYVESPAMRMLLKKLEAKTYLDLVAASSIIRPGVAQSGMMREYILRFRHPERRQYIDPIMERLMSETFGIMVYQEDVIKVAHHFAGITLEEADMLRRGMSGKYRAREEFAKVQARFFECAAKNGRDPEVTKEVWRQIESFAGYAFSKGHSASYAVESYQSLFLKAYYPLEHMVGVINNFGGFYRTELYVHEARMCGAVINAPDINLSEHTTTIYGNSIYLGFIHMADLEQKVIESILQERAASGPFQSLRDLMDRVSMPVEQLRLLIRVGAFRFTGRTKKQLLWEIHTLAGDRRKTEVRKELFPTEARSFTLPRLHHGKYDDAMDELEILGFPLRSPFELIKGAPDVPALARDLEKNIGKDVSILGYFVTYKHTRTKRGDSMGFGTFLDREGYFIDTTHFPNVFAQYPFRGKGCYLLKGKVSEEFGFCSLDITEMHYLDRVIREDGDEEEVVREGERY
jgi:DNA polymerase-3 subunit alpha